MMTCTIKGKRGAKCKRKSIARDMCWLHYRRFLMFGDARVKPLIEGRVIKGVEINHGRHS